MRGQFLGIFILGGLLLFSLFAPEAILEEAKRGNVAVHEATKGSAELYQVVAVIDGDTIEVQVGTEIKRVRYIGIDTPELYPRGSQECLAQAAFEYNQSLLQAGEVRLVRDVRDVDDYGRWLRYVYVGDMFVNFELVKAGYAQAVEFEPDVAQKVTLNQAEFEARGSGLGIWGQECR